MGGRSSRQKADITTPPPKEKKQKHKKSKKDAANGGIEEVSIQEKKDDAEITSEQQNGADVAKAPELDSSKKAETDSNASGNAPTDIIEDSPDKETEKVAQLSEVQSPSESATSPVDANVVICNQGPTKSETEAKGDGIENKVEIEAQKSQPEPVVDTKPQPLLEAKSKPVAEAESVKIEAAKVAEPIAETKPEPVLEVKKPIVETEPVVEAKPEQVTEVKAEPVEVKSEPIIEAKAEPVDAIPEPVVEAEPVVETRTESEPIVETKVELETKSEPIVEANPEPVAIIKTEAVVEVVPEPVVETKPKPVEAKSDATVESNPEPVMESKPEPMEEPAQEKITESQLVTSEPEPISSPVVEPVAAPEALPVVEASIESSEQELAVEDKLESPVIEPSQVEELKQEPVTESHSETTLPEEPLAEKHQVPTEMVVESVPTPLPEKELKSPASSDGKDQEPIGESQSTEVVSESNIASPVLQPESVTNGELEAPKDVAHEGQTGDHTLLQSSDQVPTSPNAFEQVNGIDAIQNGTDEVTTNGQGEELPSEVPTLISWKHGGNEVAICGDFCKWTDNCCLSNSDGIFTTKIKLPIGEHHIKFLVDGEWKVDESEPVVELEGHGQVNLLVVGAGTE